MIPKKIHYIWFGEREKPSDVIKYIESWKTHLPDYEIIEWNEKNYDLSKVNSRYVEDAIKLEKWAFVSDYVRLDVLNRIGGIYFDTDVEVLKNMDELLEEKSFLGMENKYAFCTAVIGSEKNQQWLKELLLDYQSRNFFLSNGKNDLTPNSKFILQKYRDRYGFSNVNLPKSVNGVMIYPSKYFSPLNYATRKMEISKKTYTIHHYKGAWKSNLSKIKDKLLSLITRILGEDLTEKIKSKVKTW